MSGARKRDLMVTAAGCSVRAMRLLPALIVMLAPTSPALAQFPPPGAYTCASGAGKAEGVLTLFVGGDYMWDGADASMGTGQMSSAGNTVEAITGLLKDNKWVGRFEEDAGSVKFAFETMAGPIGCE
ncbi:MAG: hypothetical protein ABL879_18260 [Devosia sp.]